MLSCRWHQLGIIEKSRRFRDWFVSKTALWSGFVVACLLVVTGCAGLKTGLPRRDGPEERLKVFVIVLDALKRGTLMESLDTLPNFQRVIVGEGVNNPYVYFPNVLVSIPSSSMPSNTTLLTGLYPRRHGVPSTVWFDRENGKRITLTSLSQRRVISFLEQNKVDTIFDYARRSGKTTMAVATQVAKGVKSRNWIKQSVHLWGQAFCLNLLRDGNPIPDGAHLDKGTTEGLLNGYLYSFADGLNGMLRFQGDIPDLTVVHYVGLDIFTHYPRRFMVKNNWTVDEIQRWYLQEILDPEIGKILVFLREKGLFENSIFFFVADHGQTKITEHIDEKAFSEGFSKEFRIMGRSCSAEAAEVVIMPGASTKAMYVKNRLTDDWMSPPRLLEDVKPAVDASINANSMDKHLNTLLVAQYPGERDRGSEKVNEFWCLDLPFYLDSNRQDNDFLGALRPLSILDRLIGKELEAPRMYNLEFSRKNKPDIILINKPGRYFAPDKGKYAHHGSIYSDDAFVSFVISGPAVRRFSSSPMTFNQQIESVDLVPIAAHLSGILIDKNIDGKNRLLEMR